MQERVRAGLRNAKLKGKTLRRIVGGDEIARLREQGSSFHEIAKAVGASPGTVRARLLCERLKPWLDLRWRSSALLPGGPFAHWKSLEMTRPRPPEPGPGTGSFLLLSRPIRQQSDGGGLGVVRSEYYEPLTVSAYVIEGIRKIREV